MTHILWTVKPPRASFLLRVTDAYACAGEADGQGYFVVVRLTVLPDWSPNGAKRFLHMVAGGFFNQAKVPMFRVVKSFLVQFGISSIPSVTRQWAALGSIPDDPNLNVPFDEG